MKRNLLAFVFAALTLFVTAQLPTIHAFTVLPANPTSSSQIKIVTHLETPNSAFAVDKHHTVTAQPGLIRLHLCYAHGMSTVISHHIDTFAVGQLPTGTYSIHLSAYMSGAGQHCLKVDSNFSSHTMTIGVNIGLRANSKSHKIRVYPNPAKDLITIEPAVMQPVRIMTLQGQLVRVADLASDGILSVRDLAAGMYLIELDSPEGKEVHSIVIQ